MQYAIVGTEVDGVPSSPVQLDVFNGDASALQQFVIPFMRLTGLGEGPLQRPSEGQFEFEVHAPTLPQVTVQVSEDAIHWSDLGPATIVDGKVAVTDQDAGVHSMRFYRSKP
jgi:hypothetical protein